MVGYALAAQNPDRISKWVVIDAPLPGIGPWDEILKSPLLWHFNFRGPDMDRLVKGRERIYLDRFWNELSARSKGHRRSDASPLCENLCAPGRDACRLRAVRHVQHERHADNKEFQARGKLTMPILALGAEKVIRRQQAAVMREVGSNVEGGIVKNSGHWIMEEQPDQTVALIRSFLDRK